MSKDIRREGSTLNRSNHLTRLTRCTRAAVMLAAGLILTAGARAESFKPADSFQPKPGAVEIPAKRTQSSKTFANPDGTRTWSASMGSVHYVDRAGQWNEIDVAIRPLSDDERRQAMLPAEQSGALDEALQSLNDPARGLRDTQFSVLSAQFSAQDSQLANVACPFAYGMTKNAYHSYFAADASSPILAKFATANWSVSFGLEGGHRGPVTIAGNTITYHDALDGADLRFTTDVDEMREEIILREQPDTAEWTFPLHMEGVRMEHGANGTLDFVELKTGKRVWFMPKPFMFDGAGARSEAVRKTVETRHGQTWLVVRPQRDWLDKEQRLYPVTVDPTWTTYTATADIYYVGTSFYEQAILQVWGSNDASVYYKSLLKWNMTGVPTPSNTPGSARMSLYTTSSSTNTNDTVSRTIDLYKCTSTWSETSLGIPSWNPTPLASLSVANVKDTPFVWRWNGSVGGIPDANGIVLVMNANVRQGRVFHSRTGTTTLVHPMLTIDSDGSLQNGALEANTTYDTYEQIFNSWGKIPQVGRVQFRTGTAGYVHTGGSTVSQRIQLTATNGLSCAVQPVTVTNGVNYTATAWVYNATANTTQARLGVNFSGGTDPYSGVTWKSTWHQGTSYLSHSVTGTAVGTSITIFLQVLLRISCLIHGLAGPV